MKFFEGYRLFINRVKHSLSCILNIKGVGNPRKAVHFSVFEKVFK